MYMKCLVCYKSCVRRRCEQFDMPSQRDRESKQLPDKELQLTIYLLFDDISSYAYLGTGSSTIGYFILLYHLV